MLTFFYKDLNTGKIIFKHKATKGTLLTKVDEAYKVATGMDVVKQNYIVCWWKEEQVSA